LGEQKLSNDDPIVIDLIQRLARLEEKVAYLQEQVDDLKGKVWWIITGIILAILTEILLKVIP